MDDIESVAACCVELHLLGKHFKPKRGRPKIYKHTILKKKHGRPRGSFKYSDADIQWLCQEVENVKQKKRQGGKNITTAKALYICIYAHFEKKGLSDFRVKKLVEENLPRLKTLLSRRANSSIPSS